MEEILGFLGQLPTELIYVVLGAGAALENLVPPIPADTFVLLGGFFAGRGRIDGWTVFAVIWVANVGSALGVYWAGRRYGRSFFAEGIGSRLLSEAHLSRIAAFYERWGFPAIFFTRFLPGLRAVVPAFAGVSDKPFLPVAVPLGVASAIWYGVLVWLGATAGRNLETIWGWVSDANRVLLVLAVILAAGIGVWWYRTHREHGEQWDEDRSERGEEGSEGHEEEGQARAERERRERGSPGEGG